VVGCLVPDVADESCVVELFRLLMIGKALK